MPLNFKSGLMSIVFYHFMKKTKKKGSFLYVATSTAYGTMQLIRLPTFFVFRWHFFNWFYLLSKWHFNRGVHSHFYSPLTFLWLSAQGAACQSLARLMLGEKEGKNLQIADVSFLLVVPITLKKWHCLKTDFRCSVFLAASVNVLPN